MLHVQDGLVCYLAGLLVAERREQGPRRAACAEKLCGAATPIREAR